MTSSQSGAIYLFSHASGVLSKVGLASDGDADGRKASYVASHNLLGWDTAPEVFMTSATTKRELYEIEQSIHARLRDAGGAFWDGKAGPQEIFAVPPAVAREAILAVLGGDPTVKKAADPVREFVLYSEPKAAFDRYLMTVLSDMCRKPVLSGRPISPGLKKRMFKTKWDRMRDVFKTSLDWGDAMPILGVIREPDIPETAKKLQQLEEDPNIFYYRMSDTEKLERLGDFNEEFVLNFDFDLEMAKAAAAPIPIERLRLETAAQLRKESWGPVIEAGRAAVVERDARLARRRELRRY